ncbi:hypothetical protein, partial [Acinetobacter pittii]|uniref:hypothetical protein n=1 Tax=Acinetobacter pittii TaxID=48296 RepID=UPI001BB464D7
NNYNILKTKQLQHPHTCNYYFSIKIIDYLIDSIELVSLKKEFLPKNISDKNSLKVHHQIIVNLLNITVFYWQ